VIHDCEGSFYGSVGWFLQADAQVSANIVLSEDGTMAVQMVGWANKAWHVCNFNPFSEGIEAAGYAVKGLGAPEWQALANITTYRLRANGLPCQRANAENNWTGYCQHADLGAAGGGHHDITSDSAVYAAFDAMVAAAYAQDMPASWGGGPIVSPLPAPPAGWSPSGTTRHDLSVGSIEWVKMRLNALHVPTVPLTVDGLDGPSTQWAVKSFQQSHGLFVDGIAGPNTVAALQ
jgi:peptidoglycan hydrolase-like protein with peptidoglycan-binding domain